MAVNRQATGVELIRKERARQKSQERWTLDHDRRLHRNGELAAAASVYAQPSTMRLFRGYGGPPIGWPRDWQFKPTPDDRIRELVKAGALIAAEIDRLQRKG